MGNKESQLTSDELKDYEELTYLSRPQILHAFIRFKEIDPKSLNCNKYARIPFEMIKEIPELQNNPFSVRIGEVFSSENDCCWSFEDFLDMVSVFHESTPSKKKIEYAFDIYDFDSDGFLSSEDLAKVILRLIGTNRLTRAEMKKLIEKILEEADLDKDNMLSVGEFEHFMMKNSDFARHYIFKNTSKHGRILSPHDLTLIQIQGDVWTGTACPLCRQSRSFSIRF